MLGSSRGELIQMLIILKFVMITVSFLKNGREWKKFCCSERRFVKGSSLCTKAGRRGRILKLGELCGLVLSMRVGLHRPLQTDFR